MKFKLISLFIFFTFSFCAWTQEKLEIEKPVHYKEVPDVAKKYVCELLPEAKIKWIYEISGESENYEAKAKSGGERYSIEFALNGEFSDVEQLIEKKDIESTVLEKIKAQFEREFDKARMSRIQHHFSGSGEEVMKLLKGQEAQLNKINQLYEIEVIGLKDKELQHFQYSFSLKGVFIERLKIVEIPNDNLFY